MILGFIGFWLLYICVLALVMGVIGILSKGIDNYGELIKDKRVVGGILTAGILALSFMITCKIVERL